MTDLVREFLEITNRPAATLTVDALSDYEPAPALSPEPDLIERPIEKEEAVSFVQTKTEEPKPVAPKTSSTSEALGLLASVAG